MKALLLLNLVLVYNWLSGICPFPLAFVNNPGVAEKRVTVAKDGSGDYTSVQAAFNHVPDNNKSRITIYVRKGIYKEKLRLSAGKRFVTLLGESKDGTILTYDDHTGKVSPDGKVINTNTSASCTIAADDFRAETITFQNTAGFTAGQAVGLEVQGDRATFINCRIVGHQDILYTNSNKSRQYYTNCYIEGTTDFIFGSATALFEHCRIHSKKNSHVTAASTPQENKYGYVFRKCTLTADSSLQNVSLGRPWKPYASVTFLECYIGPHILAAGWNNWNNPANEKTARYAEYKNYGPGANTSGRAGWSRQLSDSEARAFTIENIFGDWNPDKKKNRFR